MFAAYGTMVDDGSSRTDSIICPKDLNMTNLIDTISNASVSLERSNHSFFAERWGLYSTVPVVLAFLMFPLLNFKSPTFFTKFNSIGTFSVMYLLVFVGVKSYSWGINITDWSVEWNLKPTFCALSGMLSMSYFIHNIIISIVKNNRYQENNVRLSSRVVCYIVSLILYFPDEGYEYCFRIGHFHVFVYWSSILHMLPIAQILP